MAPFIRMMAILLMPVFLWPAQGRADQTGPEREPHAVETGQVREKKKSDQDIHEAESSIKRHRQKNYQRKTSEQVRTGTHDSTVKVDEPQDIFESDEARAADHIPEPLPSDEVRPTRVQKKAPGPAPPPRKKSELERAWIKYNRRQYSAAAELFGNAVKTNPGKALNARMGLAYSRLKQGRRVEATAQLKYLVKRRYRLKETLPLLLDLLVAGGDYRTAQNYLPLIPQSEKKKWTRKILESELVTDYRALKEKAVTVTGSEWVRFIKQHDRALEMCIRPDIFFDAAIQLKDLYNRENTVVLQRSLLSCNLSPDLRIGVVERLSGQLPPVAAAGLLRDEKRWFQNAAPQYLPRINQVELATLRRRLNDARPGTAEQRTAAEAILELDPTDRDAQAVIAWSDLQQKKYRRSETRFEKLWQANPANRDYALGLGYSRLNSGRYADALVPFQDGLIPDDDRTLELKRLVYKARGQSAYERQNWPAAAENLEAALKIDPNDAESKSLLAWTRFRQNRRDEALTLMESAYEQKPDRSTAGALMDLYGSGPETSRSRQFALEMAESPDQANRTKAGQYFFSRGAPVTASQADNSPGACYTGAASPRIEAFVYHKNKTGDDGTSELAETSFPVTGVYPTRWGNQWSLSVTPRYLNSGDAPDRPFAGKFYRFLNGGPQKNNLEDSVWIWQPDIGFEKEGTINISSHLGSSPIGGAVSPTPTGSLRLSTESWFVDLHRRTVKDSILSYTGLEDPYSSSEWGRVLRNGISAGVTRPVLNDYWVNVTGGYDFYTGENLWDNSSVNFNAAAGRTFDRDGDEMTLGVFFTAQHYRRNSDFYTYGHGGYYSPELMTLIGPFFRYRSALCRTYWFDIQLSAGWLHQKLDSSPVYPEFDGDVTGFTPAAAADALSEYSGETDNKLGLSAKIQGMKLLTDQLAVGGFAGVDNNADFTSWQVGVGLQFFFERQNVFWQRRDFFKDFGDCSNR